MHVFAFDYIPKHWGGAHTFYREIRNPRQPGLIQEAKGWLEFFPPFAQPEAFEALEGFSHLWVIFDFHKVPARDFQASVRPPRLGGNAKVGVFYATRSPFRPNRLGLSVVENEGWVERANKRMLQVGGVDLVDQTPILDVKPYLPYCEALPQARGGYAERAPLPRLTVSWHEGAIQDLSRHPTTEAFKTLIQSVLEQDPRPAYRHSDGEHTGGVLLGGFNIRYRLEKKLHRSSFG